MFNKPGKKSAIIDFKNHVMAMIQNSPVSEVIRDSFFFEKIDVIIYAFLIMTLVSSVFFSSDVIGTFAVIFSVLQSFKLLVKKGEATRISLFDKAIMVYFAFVILSLFGSSLFILSLKGFLKTAVYFYFYFSALSYFRHNKEKIIPTIFIIALLVSFESVIAIIQNYTGVLEISGWQDKRNLDPTLVMSRAYGTLKPYNPNLLAGYLVAGLSSLWCLSAINFKNKNKKRGFCFLALLLIATIAIIDTGSRGGYLGILAFYLLFAFAVYYFVNRYLGGFAAIKKRYKNILAGIIAAAFVMIFANPVIRNRIFSIFQFRGDSSISFRMNVYASSWQMFLDNPFLGIGVGNKNFREIYGLYMRSGFDALGAYCVPLEIAVESGIFALGAFITFLVLWLRDCFKIISNAPIIKKIIVFSLILSVISTMTHGLFDTVWFRPQLQILFWLNVAFLGALKS